MHSKKGQSAMEYVLSYGWMFIVVLILTSFLIRTEVFQIRVSIPPTSEGFQALKPILARCEMGNGIWYSNLPTVDYNGLKCNFINNGGTKIRIIDIDIDLDGKYCRFPLVERLDKYTSGESHWITRACVDEDDCNVIPVCYNEQIPGFCVIPTGSPVIHHDEQFFVFALSHYNPTNSDAIGPCVNIEPGHAYTVHVDIVYEVWINELWATKHSGGTLYVHA